MKGFTLIELIIVIAILAIVSAMSVPFFQSFQSSSDLYTSANTIVRTLRKAQQQSIAGKNGLGWGVYFDNGNKKFILFSGSDYATREQSYDQDTSYPQSFTVSTDFSDEIKFSRYSSNPSTAGTITISSNNSDVSKVISISDIGLIQIDN